jgi:hypothetical protein
MQFTIEFFRTREADKAQAILDRLTCAAPDLEGAKRQALSLFETLDMPQAPDGLRILDHDGVEVFACSPAR